MEEVTQIRERVEKKLSEGRLFGPDGAESTWRLEE